MAYVVQFQSPSETCVLKIFSTCEKAMAYAHFKAMQYKSDVEKAKIPVADIGATVSKIPVADIVGGYYVGAYTWEVVKHTFDEDDDLDSLHDIHAIDDKGSRCDIQISYGKRLCEIKMSFKDATIGNLRDDITHEVMDFDSRDNKLRFIHYLRSIADMFERKRVSDD